MTLRNISIAKCPNCNNRPTVYTVGNKHGVSCSANDCGVHLPIADRSITETLYQWNTGLNLKKCDGTPYFVDSSKQRRMIKMAVDV